MRIISGAAICFMSLAVYANEKPENNYQPPIFTEQNRVEKIQAVLPAISKMYGDYARKNHFPGYVFGVMVDGKLIYVGQGGYLDIDKKTLANGNSLFRIASMTKSLTAMAILQLRDQGKLNLDDRVEKYIPELKDQHLTNDAPAITIRQLLTHAAGFPEDNPWGDRQLAVSDEAMLAMIKKGIAFSNTSETHYEYSNMGFAMLGYIIQKVSGMPYQKYIAQNIWQPLAMNEATWEFASIPPASYAHGYRWVDHHWQNEALLHDGSYASMGGMMTSMDSFARYVGFQMSAWPPRDDVEVGPIKRSSLREMQQPWRFNNVYDNFKRADGSQCSVVNAYAYGLVWMRDCDAKVYIGHTGGLPGFGSNWLMLPEYGVAVALFANVTYAPTSKINYDVINVLVAKAKLKPRELPVSSILQQRQAELVKALTDWKAAEKSNIFAVNFFLDHPAASLQKEIDAAFKKIGKIKSVSAVVPENQLRGYFVMNGEKGKMKVYFTLTPEHTPLIQSYKHELDI